MCTNWASAPMERLDTAVVDAFTKKVFTDDLVEDIIERVTELREAKRAARTSERPRLDSELRRAIEKRIADWRGLFHRHPEQAREAVLRPLLGGRRLVLTPTITADGRLYAFEQKLSYGALIAGLIGAGDARVMTVVPPG